MPKYQQLFANHFFLKETYPITCQPHSNRLFEFSFWGRIPSIWRLGISGSCNNINIYADLWAFPIVCEGRAWSSAYLTCPIGVDPITNGDSFFSADDGATHRVADDGEA